MAETLRMNILGIELSETARKAYRKVRGQSGTATRKELRQHFEQLINKDVDATIAQARTAPEVAETEGDQNTGGDDEE
jgi:hypothetical protein